MAKGRHSLTHSLTHSRIGRFCRAGLFCLLFTAILSFAHCSSSNGGGGGGPKYKYTCTNGTPSEGRPDGDSDIEQCVSCNDGYGLVADEAICREPFFLHSNGITVRCPNAAVGASGTVRTTEYTKRVVSDIEDLLMDDANNPAIATTCTSGITNMSAMFMTILVFNQDIGSWDVSSVTSMGGMFWSAQAFNQDIGGWDVSSVTSMNNLFAFASSFDQDLSGWCVSGIGSEPSSFAFGASSGFTVARQPQWGTDVASCP